MASVTGTAPPRAASQRDKLMMLVATAARMGLGLVTFVLLARFLGPAQFGVIATAMAYGSLLAMATDYGLATSALRLASMTPDRTGAIVGDAVAVKAALAVPTFAAALALVLWATPIAALGVVALIFLGTLAYSFADLMMVAVRAHRRFDVEAAVVVATSAVMLAVVGGVAAATRSLLPTALAFMATRLAYLVVVRIVLADWLEPLARLGRSLAAMRQTLRASAAYALDNLLTVLSGQIDVLVFATMLTTLDLGIYQAGARLVQVIAPFAVVLATVHLPALSSAVASGGAGAFRSNARRAMIEFSALGIAVGLAFAVLGPLLTRWFYGSAYAPLGPLWAGFAAYAMFRLAGAGFGVPLVALGKMKARILVNIISLISFAVLSFFLIPKLGIAASSWMLAALGGMTFFGLFAVLIACAEAPRRIMMILAGVISGAASLIFAISAMGVIS